MSNGDIFDPVEKPEHYAKGDLECIDWIRMELTDEEYLGYLKGCHLKYFWRYADKGKPVQDLAKMNWYGKKLQEEIDYRQENVDIYADTLKEDCRFDVRCDIDIPVDGEIDAFMRSLGKIKSLTVEDSHLVHEGSTIELNFDKFKDYRLVKDGIEYDFDADKFVRIFGMVPGKDPELFWDVDILTGTMRIVVVTETRRQFDNMDKCIQQGISGYTAIGLIDMLYDSIGKDAPCKLRAELESFAPLSPDFAINRMRANRRIEITIKR